ncbi:MAG: UDP-N-acetylglucosamine 1-carboxyvinyltransferase [Chthonomonadales bacterium]|nr:UDP-N-acetylglucosamine 1-carboxyvinyltransferase [Chthonomonadales bacterium]
MDTFIIRGGKPLSGRVATSGSKNATLAIMAGAVLAEGSITLRNVPRIGDIQTMVELLNVLGAPTRFVDPTTVTIDATNVHCLEAPYELVRKMRASFSVLGPLLARFGFARVPVPGGCDIGARPVNYHTEGLRRLGANLHSEHGVYTAEARKLTGAEVYLDFQSAGATQHLMTAACLASGTTVIENCATEPEVVDLAAFLNALGAKVSGAGTTAITVEGVSKLHGGEYSVIPDRLEAGTFAIAAAITGGDITIEGAVIDHMRPTTLKLAEAGAHIVELPDGIRVRASGRLRAVDLKTMPHPGFPTDMQQPMAALLATAEGTSVITENVYESRFRYVNELNRMGASIRVEGRAAVITGVDRLTGAPVTATDLRAGAALICAALAADGETEMSGVEHIERGYERIAEKLRGLGVDISAEA